MIRIRIDLESRHVADVFVEASSLVRRINGRQAVSLSYSLITGRAAANKSVSSIGSASEGAWTSKTSCAHLHTNSQIIVELISVGTATFVTANSINASIVSAWRGVTFVLVYTLVMIEMLDETVWASTTVRPHKILATVFAISIVSAFIVIRAKSSSVVQFETSRANALETS